ncbi:MAG: LysR family transcriptional regulator, hypochlorite-specific transcription factor HypT [Pseudomonadota bacterium]|nr:LysR family transcriptional regulator, hypochlorite-specific transcription factor HypT [Pseudomonadota bacterium]
MVETKWLEDFVSLAETRSFSRSAQLRHVTQPAFSRRIQALEAWAGIDLVDRSSYPTRLTSAGQTLLPQALEILGSLQAARNLMRGHQTSSQDMIEFAVPHSLAFTFFPHWVMELRQRFGGFKSRLVGMNVHDAVMQLTEGSCDLLLAYHHASQPLQLNPQRYEHLSLGTETLAPYARSNADGEPLFRLPGRQNDRVPYLGYASAAYLGRMVDLLLKQSSDALYLDPIYETDMAEGLKAMALEGHGLAFLPASSVRKEVSARRLVPAGPRQAQQAFEVTMEVRLYRERPEVSRHNKPAAQALWDFLRLDLQRRLPGVSHGTGTSA